MTKIPNSEYTVKDDKGREHIFESYIPNALFENAERTIARIKQDNDTRYDLE